MGNLNHERRLEITFVFLAGPPREAIGSPVTDTPGSPTKLDRVLSTQRQQALHLLALRAQIGS
jgi:hypothetical protein